MCKLTLTAGLCVIIASLGLPGLATGAPANPCQGKADGNYAKPDDDNSFYQCVAGKTYVQTCQAGLVYSVSKDACDYPDKSGIPVQGFCSGKADGNYAKPDDDNSFYQCVAGKTYVQTCQPGLVYSVSKDACDYPASPK
ncbi:acidic mammalian chitinase-like [Pseudoliparis swirei]|uniref:acidic mammalian chitinase-like n=1 Tax=Pseudoliparis swirei TaxID=2059687 RepID=UPI0024BE893A|nr:acidic mammalian chitinase-like [Pseudoliparis swirei]